MDGYLDMDGWMDVGDWMNMDGCMGAREVGGWIGSWSGETELNLNTCYTGHGNIFTSHLPSI